jgi:hypothetical protein
MLAFSRNDFSKNCRKVNKALHTLAPTAHSKAIISNDSDLHRLQNKFILIFNKLLDKNNKIN